MNWKNQYSSSSREDLKSIFNYIAYLIHKRYIYHVGDKYTDPLGHWFDSE